MERIDFKWLLSPPPNLDAVADPLRMTLRRSRNVCEHVEKGQIFLELDDTKHLPLPHRRDVDHIFSFDIDIAFTCFL